MTSEAGIPSEAGGGTEPGITTEAGIPSETGGGTERGMTSEAGGATQEFDRSEGEDGTGDPRFAPDENPRDNRGGDREQDRVHARERGLGRGRESDRGNDRGQTRENLPSPLGELRVDTVLESIPAIARLTAQAWLRTAAWGVGAGTKVGVRLVRAAVDPHSAATLVEEVGSGMRHYARAFLGISDLDERIRRISPGDGRFIAGAGPAAAARARWSRRADRGAAAHPASEESLRAQAAELLRQSADVRVEDHLHPAYARILQELAPDEGRILRLLAAEGPQPVVDVRAANLIGVGSQLVGHGLNMVGAEAGCRHVDRVPAYLDNLHRLGLTQFSDEPLEDPIRYQVLEAQPDVLQAIKSTSRAKTVQRTLRLTPFGKDFCDVVLPTDTDEIEALTGEVP